MRGPPRRVRPRLTRPAASGTPCLRGHVEAGPDGALVGLVHHRAERPQQPVEGVGVERRERRVADPGSTSPSPSMAKRHWDDREVLAQQPPVDLLVGPVGPPAGRRRGSAERALAHARRRPRSPRAWPEGSRTPHSRSPRRSASAPIRLEVARDARGGGVHRGDATRRGRLRSAPRARRAPEGPLGPGDRGRGGGRRDRAGAPRAGRRRRRRRAAADAALLARKTARLRVLAGRRASRSTAPSWTCPAPPSSA